MNLQIATKKFQHLPLETGDPEKEKTFLPSSQLWKTQSSKTYHSPLSGVDNKILCKVYICVGGSLGKRRAQMELGNFDTKVLKISAVMISCCERTTVWGYLSFSSLSEIILSIPILKQGLPFSLRNCSYRLRL